MAVMGAMVAKRHMLRLARECEAPTQSSSVKVKDSERE